MFEDIGDLSVLSMEVFEEFENIKCFNDCDGQNSTPMYEKTPLKLNLHEKNIWSYIVIKYNSFIYDF